MVLIRDLAAALALASAAFAFEFPGLGNEQSGLAPRGAAALEDVLDRFLKRDVSGLDAEFADLSARDIEDLIARDPQVAELVQNLGEQFVKRDGSEITTRDLQLVTRSAAAGEAAGTGLWSAVKSVFARDLDEDDLLARDLDILQENFVRRDGAEISYDDLALLTRDAPKAQAPIAQMEKKLKKEEKALDKAEDKIAKGEKNLAADMLNFAEKEKKNEDKADGEDKKDSDSKKSDNKKSDSRKTDSKPGSKKSEGEGKEAGEHKHNHKHHDHDHHHKSHKAKPETKKAKARAKKLHKQKKKLLKQKQKTKARISKKKEELKDMERGIKKSEDKMEKLTSKLTKIEKEQEKFEQKIEKAGEKELAREKKENAREEKEDAREKEDAKEKKADKGDDKKSRRDLLWAREAEAEAEAEAYAEPDAWAEAEAEAYAEPNAWAEAEAYLDDDGIELLARELAALEARDPGFAGMLSKGASGAEHAGGAGVHDMSSLRAEQGGAGGVHPPETHAPPLDYKNLGAQGALQGAPMIYYGSQQQRKRDVIPLDDDNELAFGGIHAREADAEPDFDYELSSLYTRDAEPESGKFSFLFGREAQPEPEADEYSGLYARDPYAYSHALESLEEPYEF